MARETIGIVNLGADARLRLERGRRGGEPVVVLQRLDIVSPARVSIPSKEPPALTADQIVELISALHVAERQLRG